MPDNPTTSLAEFIREKCQTWRNNRQPLESKWNLNIDYFRANDTEHRKWKTEEGEAWRSDTFIQVTRMKVMAAVSLVVDMELSGGGIPFDLVNNPMADIEQEQLPEPMQAVNRDARAKMKANIQRQMLACHADRQYARIILSAAIYGEGYGKRYMHEIRRGGWRKSVPDSDQWEEYSISEWAPGLAWVSTWDIYRDLETDNLTDSAGICEISLISKFSLRQLRNEDGYFKEDIDRLLKDYDRTDKTKLRNTTGKPTDRDLAERESSIERIEFWGRVPREYVRRFMDERKSAGIDLERNEQDDGDDIEVHAVMVDNCIIRLFLTEPEDRPYYRLEWEESIDSIDAHGVADAVQDMQRVINGGWRAFEDNKKLSGNVMFAAVKRYMPAGWDGKFKPGVAMELEDSCKDIRQAMQQFVVTDVGDSLISLLNYSDRYLEETSLIPNIVHGVNPSGQDVQTAYQAAQMADKGAKYLAKVVRNIDEMLTEPIVADFYRYNMLDPNSPAKGDWNVTPIGYSLYQDRVLLITKINQFIQAMSSSPQLADEIDWRPLAEQIAKAHGFSENSVLLTADEKQARDEARASDPVRQLELQTAQAEAEKAKAEAEATRAKIEMEQRKLELEFEKLKLDRAEIASKIRSMQKGRQSAEKNVPDENDLIR
jgi:hypothetical protein